MRVAFLLIAISAAGAIAQSPSPAPMDSNPLDSYITPYVESNNFSGDVLVERDGKIIFQNAYGFADRAQKVPNTNTTRFHIASMSMQFTAAAILRLADEGTLSLDSTVGDFLPGSVGADKIKVRDLLTERSGLPDINELPDYNDVLQHHQTPVSLVAKIRGRPLLFKPGSKFLREEHSAYNLLALIVEEKTRVPFAAAVQRLVFQLMGLDESFVDDDSATEAKNVALGYQPEGVDGLEPATLIQWSAKTGNASVCTTVGDEARWVNTLFNGHVLSNSSKNAILDTSERVGYGWFKGTNKRFGGTAYYMNGRAPGFASFVLYLPREALTVVVFSNIYSSATTDMGNDIASIALGLPHESFQRVNHLPSSSLTVSTGTFQFGPDFYQKSAKVNLFVNGSDLSLRWPSGDVSSLIPISQDHFIDRNYWEHVRIERDAEGRPNTLLYDRFRGDVVKDN
jgi:D-alanyl-D-alanine carboxypeptidase